jgi:60 kDa SS-A/Ro ribonucleoprotein
MLWALQRKINLDVFVVYTDNETWAGKMQPVQALQKYRAEMNPSAKLIVVGMTATNFSIADPRDAGMLDIVGFDTNIPLVVSNFVTG